MGWRITSRVVRRARSHRPSPSSAFTIASLADGLDVLAQRLAKKVRASAGLPARKSAEHAR